CGRPMVRAGHDGGGTGRASLSDSPERLSAWAKRPSRKLRVGRACRRLNVSRLATVPSSRYLAVAGPKERLDRSRAAAAVPAASARGVRCEPATTTALRRLDPRTAPVPPRPAWRFARLTHA